MVRDINLELLKVRLEELKKHNINKIFAIVYNNEDRNNIILIMKAYL